MRDFLTTGSRADRILHARATPEAASWPARREGAAIILHPIVQIRPQFCHPSFARQQRRSFAIMADSSGDGAGSEDNSVFRGGNVKALHDEEERQVRAAEGHRNRKTDN